MAVGRKLEDSEESRVKKEVNEYLLIFRAFARLCSQDSSARVKAETRNHDVSKKVLSDLGHVT